MVITIEALCFVGVLFWPYSPYLFHTAEERGPSVWNSLKKSRNLQTTLFPNFVHGSKLNIKSGEVKVSVEVFQRSNKCLIMAS